MTKDIEKNKYIGEVDYFNGMHGEGCYYFASGNKYEGQIIKGDFNGLGR